MNFKGYAGIVGKSIHKTKEKDSNYKIFAIFPNRKTAKLAYEMVMKCEIIINEFKKSE